MLSWGKRFLKTASDAEACSRLGPVAPQIDKNSCISPCFATGVSCILSVFQGKPKNLLRTIKTACPPLQIDLHYHWTCTSNTLREFIEMQKLLSLVYSGTTFQQLR